MHLLPPPPEKKNLPALTIGLYRATSKPSRRKSRQINIPFFFGRLQTNYRMWREEALCRLCSVCLRTVTLAPGPFVIYRPQVRVFIVMYGGPSGGCDTSSRRDSRARARRPAPRCCVFPSGKPPQRFGGKTMNHQIDARVQRGNIS